MGQQRDTVRSDTSRYRIVNPYRPSFRLRDRYGDPFSSYRSFSPLFLQDSKNLGFDLQIDTGRTYTIYERMGKLNFRSPTAISFDEFNQEQDKLIKREYWQTRSKALDGESAVSGRGLIPKIYVSPVLDRIFGGSYVELIPRGFVNLDFGAQFQKLENPSIPIRQQRNGGFEFDQQINLSVQGKVGEKLAVTTNFDNNNSFDFQNNMKVEYTGFKEDILKKLEIGNVSLPLNNSLITGSQNLFGVKAQMQFGKLFVTTLATTQRGKQSSIKVNGSTNGASQGRPFEIVGSNYDENRHFFLGQFFRDNFENWLSTLPQITSGINITRVEVYLLNRQNDTQTLRNVVGLMDMGEAGKIYRSNVITPNTNAQAPTANNANNLFTLLGGISANSDGINQALEGLGLVNGTDFEKITSARKLAPTEYTFHKELGYLTLQRKLQNDEALAVAFEYTYNGRAYKVGELSEDYGNKPEDQVAYLKLLRPRKIAIKDPQGKILPTWDLMMKNIYNLNVSGLTRDGFQLRLIYRDDRTGIDNPQLQEGDFARTQQLIRVFGLDRLNPYNDPQPDGNFDYVEKVTINSETGTIVFPFLEPFNKALRELFANETNLALRDQLIRKYVYDTLYRTTKAEAELVTTKNKFYLVGSFKAGSGKEIIIQGFNISPGSVKVYAGGMPLQEGLDYTVDYTFGKVTILNEGILTSGKDIDINYEQQDPFAFQTRSLLGTRLDYKLNDNINIGSTLLYYNERPLVSRNLIGTEPARNLQYGLDFNMRKESRFLTKMVDALPFLQTKEQSTVTLNAEFAQLLPGTSNIVDGDGTSFIDDFENTATPYSLLSPQAWKLASIPKEYDPTNGSLDNIEAGYRRAKLAWYQVDNLFYRTGGRFKPNNLSEADMANHYVRAVKPTEIFPNFDPFVGNFFEQIFDLAYYPEERGPYNYNTQLNNFGRLNNPRNNWAGITTAIRTEVDFDKANIEYIEFWLLDPFINNPRGLINDGVNPPQSNTTGGKLIFHLGSVSEDVLRDGKHAFENGLPADGDLSPINVTENNWGYVTNKQYLNNAFDNNTAARPNQDVGLDGIANAQEATKFQNNFLNLLNPAARAIAERDPSADDFQYFLGNNLDARDAKILERYKNFNNQEGNTPILTGNEAFAISGTTIPDNEDLNQDNTLSDLEEYYSYNIDLTPSKLRVGNKYIVDAVQSSDNPDATWYLFRIPVRQFDGITGNIDGFKSIRYVRMVLTDFDKPVVLRMAKFRAVGNRWRRYTENLEESRFGEPIEPNLDNFSVSVVNVEENSVANNVKPGYIEPLRRDRDNTSAVQRRLNEQSVQMCVTELPDGDARAIYKNVSMDFFNYGRIKMFISAHNTNLAKPIQDNELVAFLRLGTDFDENYYEIELPLKITPAGVRSVDEVWPEQNQIDLDLNELYALKARRDREGFNLGILYPQSGPEPAGKHGIRILGRPDLSQVRTMMIGIRNPRTNDAKTFDVCLWANEMRLTDFDRTAGWAANVMLNTKLADLGTVSGSLRHISFGYGGVQSKISERARGETTRYDVSANLNIDKLLPQWTGLKIPMFISYENTTINPKYDPANPDLRILAALQSFNSDAEREEYLKIIQDRSVRRSLNFTNVRKVKTNQEAVPHIYDIENFSFTYAFSEATQTNFNLRENTMRNYRGAVVWQYSPKFKGFEPFKDAKALKSPFLQLIKDFNFNPMPSNISVRGELDRSFTKMVYRNASSDLESSIPNFQKFFVFNRFYNVRWNITKTLGLDYASRVNAIIDEPDGDLDNRDSIQVVINNLKKLGRMKNFDQNITANYTLPLEKLPFTNWLNAEYRYNVGYNWQAGPLEKDESLRLGNIIQNTQDQGLSGRVDLVKLYNKIGFLKTINTPPRPAAPVRPGTPAAKPTQPDTIKRPPDLKAIKGMLRLIMSVRNITGTYTVTQGTLLPGFTPDPYLFGLDKGWAAPGWGFILGQQEAGFQKKAGEKGWLTRSQRLTTPFTQKQMKDLSLSAAVEPSTELRIKLDVKKNSTTAFQEIFRIDSAGTAYESLSPSRIGSYKISINTINTAFSNNQSLNSTVFKQFEENIAIMQNRFSTITGNAYESRSQDVLIPAFLAAYTGQSAERTNLSPFPRLPIPSWRVDYTGLSKMGNLKDIFQSITINHAYASSYSVVNYSNSLEYDQVSLNNPIENYNNGLFASKTNSNGELIPVYVISQVMISEQFSPLIGVNLRTKKKLNFKFEYKTKRDLALNISNSQVTELNSKDWSVSLGYTKNNMRLPFKSDGKVITLKNDVVMQMDMSVTNNRTIQRKIAEVNTVTNGNINFQLRPNVSYLVNQKLRVQAYMERSVNEPLVTNSFRRSTTRAGFKIIFNLAQ
ncbi:MAG: cell surface protein SprA [Cyclobacteriaceae bacterium]|nr:cell surface protein SprA [Cyclobacteriaceae bacterium]